MIAIKEEGRLSKRSRDNGRHPRVYILRWVGRDNREGIPTIRTQEAIARASIAGLKHITKTKLGTTHLFFSARTLALGTSNKQFGQ